MVGKVHKLRGAALVVPGILIIVKLYVFLKNSTNSVC